MKTRSQEYSKEVFEQINGLNLDDSKKKTYGSLCHNFPLMVLRSGLSQSVAFLLVKTKISGEESKQSTPHIFFLENLADLTGIDLNLQEGEKKAIKFQEKINTLELHDYMRITRRILAASIWYKRFAESLLDVNTGEEIPDSAQNEEETSDV